MKKILEVRNLSKNYGSIQAVKSINFSISEKEIFALIGPNGAGKSTTLKMVSTILQPSAGEIIIDGIDVLEHPDQARKKISYLPEEAGAYKRLSGRGYLNFMAGLSSNNNLEQKDYLQKAISIVGFESRLNDKLANYSKGMIRKVMLARALMSNPRLAILDEPTSGLDVINALEIRNIIVEFARRGSAVLVSSHNMLEIEYLAGNVAIIDNGKIIETGTVQKLNQKHHAENLEEVFLRLKTK